MPVIVEQRVINATVQRDPEDLAHRKHLCAVFRYALKTAHLSAKSFSKISLVPLDTVYSWTAHGDRCVPPPPIAMLLLRLIERDPMVIRHLDALVREDFPVCRVSEE